MNFRDPCLLCRLVPEPVDWGGLEKGLQKSSKGCLGVRLPVALLLCLASTHQCCLSLWFSLLQPSRNPGRWVPGMEADGVMGMETLQTLGQVSFPWTT